MKMQTLLRCMSHSSILAELKFFSYIKLRSKILRLELLISEVLCVPSSK